MGGYDRQTGFTIGYNYLAAQVSAGDPSKGPDQGWSGPVKATETREVIADANYWSKTSTLAMTLAPHTSGGGLALTANAVALPGPTPGNPAVPGATSTVMGAVGGNIGSLNGSVVWRSIHSMTQYPASKDGMSAFGNW
jgi:hypothetical protein